MAKERDKETKGPGSTRVAFWFLFNRNAFNNRSKIFGSVLEVAATVYERDNGFAVTGFRDNRQQPLCVTTLSLFSKSL